MIIPHDFYYNISILKYQDIKYHYIFILKNETETIFLYLDIG